MKKWIIRIVALVIFLVAAALIYIEINKERLVSIAVKKANESISGEIAYVDADVSLLRSFPDLRLTLKELVIASDVRQGDRQLFESEEVYLDLNLISVIKSSRPIEVTSISIEGPLLHLSIDPDGQSNFDILNTSGAGGAAPIDLSIADFNISDGQLSYVDRATGYRTILDQLYSQARVKYTNGLVEVDSDLSFDLNLKYGRMLPSYQVKVGASSSMAINAQMDSINVTKALVTLNDLPIELSGGLTLNPSDVGYDFDFSSPATAIKRLISLLPNYYKNQYSQIISQGTYTLKGSATGRTSQPFPLYDLKITAEDGVIAYPDLGQKIDRIDFDLRVKNDRTNKAYSSINVRQLDFKAGKSTAQGNLSVLPLGSDHQASADLTLNIDLKDIERSVVLSESSFSGKIDGDIKAEALIKERGESNVQKGALSTMMTLSDIEIMSGGDTFGLSNGSIKGDQNKLLIGIDQFKYNNAVDGSIEATLDHPLTGWLSPQASIDGQVTLDIGMVDMNQLSSPDTSVRVAYDIPLTDLDINMTIDSLIYGTYHIKGVAARGNLKDDMSQATYSIGEMVGSQFSGEIALNNILSYGLNNDTLDGKIVLRSNQLDLDEFMRTGEGNNQVVSNKELIPDNINIDIDYQSDQIVFKNIDIAQSLGQVGIRDNKVIFKNAGRIFGGDASFTGVFDSNLPEGYNINLNLELNELQFSETANRLKLFSQILPVAKFLEGKYSAVLQWESDLSESYIPDLNSLSAFGEIETQDGGINGLLPIDTFIRRLVNIDNNNILKLDDTKRYFIIEDGKVVIKDLVIKQDDILISLSGSHGFNQELAYQLSIDIPSSRLKADGLLSLLQDKLNFSDQLKKIGADVQVQVIAYMGGTITHPTFAVQKVNLKSGSIVESIEDKAKETISDAADSIKQKVQDTISQTTDMVLNKIDSTKESILSSIDSVKEDVSSAIDTTIASLDDIIAQQKEDLKNEGSVLLDSIKAGNVDSVLQRIEDLFGKKQGQLDSIKLKLPTKLPGGLLNGLKKKGGS